MIKLTKIKELPEFTFEDYKGSQAPTPQYSEGFPNNLRLWFSARDKDNRSHPFYYDLEIYESGFMSIKDKLTKKPPINLGKPGTFNDSGNMVSFVRKNYHFNNPFMMFTGWNNGDKDVRYRLSLGVTEDSTWNEDIKVDLWIDRHKKEPLGMSMPVLSKDGKTCYYMSIRGWVGGEAHYDIRSFQVKDPNNPTTILSGHACFARPWLRERDDKPDQLWYCHRSFEGFRDDTYHSYMLGVLEKHNDEWFPAFHKLDSEFHETSFMKAYPSTIDTPYGSFLFYNESFTGPICIARIEDV